MAPRADTPGARARARLGRLSLQLCGTAAEPPGDAARERLPGQQLSRPHSHGYTYTHPDAVGLLTPEQVDFYEANGFLVVRGCLPPADCEAYARRALDLLQGRVPAAGGMQVVRDIGCIRAGRAERSELTVNKIARTEADPVLAGYARHPRLLHLVPAWTGRGGAKVVPFSSMVVNKPPDAGSGSSRHPPHQDLWYWPLRPASLMVGAWTALEPCTRANGCLFVLPGSHRGALEAHEPPTDGEVNAGFVGVEGRCDERDVEAGSYAWLEMAPGDTVFFHPLLKHGSGRNGTAGTRKAISVHFASTDCIYFDTRQDPVQRRQADRAQRTAAQGVRGRPQGGHAEDFVQTFRRQLRDGGHCSQVLFGQEGRHPGAI